MLGVGVFVFLLATSGWPGWGRLRQTPAQIFDIHPPLLPDGTTVAVAGEPVGYIIPFFQGKDLHFVGLEVPPHTRLQREIASRIGTASTLRVLLLDGDQQASRQLVDFDIKIDVDRCTRVLTGRRFWGAIKLCHVSDRN
jgi:hypothetical protein